MELRRRAAWPSWWRVLLIGLALWAASVAITGVTGNFNLVPTVVLLGSFLVPVTAVLWYLDHYDSQTLSGRDVFNGFLVGGVLGVLGASVLESWLLTGGAFVYLVVGLIEEGAKFIALLIVARGVPRTSIRDGVVLGAAVGFGFAAFESSGYALAALFSTSAAGGLSLGALVETELLRGVLAPLGHGLWTAILGGVLFASPRPFRSRLRPVILTYIGVAVLHALWDSMRGLSLLLTMFITGTPLQAVPTQDGEVLAPTAQQVHVFTEIEIAGYAAISFVGLVWLAVLWRRDRQDVAGAAAREAA